MSTPGVSCADFAEYVVVHLGAADGVRDHVAVGPAGAFVQGCRGLDMGPEPQQQQSYDRLPGDHHVPDPRTAVGVVDGSGHRLRRGRHVPAHRDKGAVSFALRDVTSATTLCTARSCGSGYPIRMRGLLTFGHGTATPGELVALMKNAGVEQVVDVRRFPGSRRNPGLSSDAMAYAADRPTTP